MTASCGSFPLSVRWGYVHMSPHWKQTFFHFRHSLLNLVLLILLATFGIGDKTCWKALFVQLRRKWKTPIGFCTDFLVYDKTCNTFEYFCFSLHGSILFLFHLVQFDGKLWCNQLWYVIVLPVWNWKVSACHTYSYIRISKIHQKLQKQNQQIWINQQIEWIPFRFNRNKIEMRTEGFFTWTTKHNKNTIFTSRQRSCDKVMLSQVSANHSVHRESGGGYAWSQVASEGLC